MLSYTRTESQIIEMCTQLALEYDCTVIVENYVLSLVSGTDRIAVGSIADIKNMTIRGLLSSYHLMELRKKCREGCFGNRFCD